MRNSNPAVQLEAHRYTHCCHNIIALHGTVSSLQNKMNSQFQYDTSSGY
jgi:hypothetical protein